MKQLQRAACLCVLAGWTGLASGCEKSRECAKLVSTINAHTPKLTAATERFGELETNPSVIDDYTAVVNAAITEVAALKLGNDEVAGFAQRYRQLLAAAKEIGPTMKQAGTDPTKLQAAMTQADEVRKTEDVLVTEVNTYCGGE